MKTQPAQRKRFTQKSKFDEALLKLGRHLQPFGGLQLVYDVKNISKFRE